MKALKRLLTFHRRPSDPDPRVWLVTLPALALAWISVPAELVPSMPKWVNYLVMFNALVVLATVYAIPVMAVTHRKAAAGRTSPLLWSWWIAGGSAIWWPAGVTATLFGAIGAAALLYLVLHRATNDLPASAPHAEP